MYLRASGIIDKQGCAPTEVGKIVHNCTDVIMYCLALEKETGKDQGERFENLYKVTESWPRAHSYIFSKQVQKTC